MNYAPFKVLQYNCNGKNSSLTEILVVDAQVIIQFRTNLRDEGQLLKLLKFFHFITTKQLCKRSTSASVSTKQTPKTTSQKHHYVDRSSDISSSDRPQSPRAWQISGGPTTHGRVFIYGSYYVPNFYMCLCRYGVPPTPLHIVLSSYSVALLLCYSVTMLGSVGFLVTFLTRYLVLLVYTLLFCYLVYAVSYFTLFLCCLSLLVSTECCQCASHASHARQTCEA